MHAPAPVATLPLKGPSWVRPRPSGRNRLMQARAWRTSGRTLVALTLALGVGTALPSAGKDKPTEDKDKGKERPAPAAGVKARLAQVDKRITAEYDSLEKLYKHLHANPELSLREFKTAARLAQELKKLGFTVTEKVGGTGVVGVFKNGKGPTVLVRTDMDALPVTERTKLDYASKVRTRDKHGHEVGVMHACGHDMHMACWVGTARVLVALKDSWKGTLVFIGQPAEEIGTGARLMLKAGLFTKFPRPEYCLALHCDGSRAHGTVAYTEGLAMANVDSVDITVKGKGGHGAAPHTTVDTVVL